MGCKGQIASSILPQILYKKHDCYENDTYISKNTLYVRDLWGLSISGDVPIVCVEITHQNEEQRTAGYIKCHKILTLCGIHFDLVFVFSEPTEQNKFISEMIKKMMHRNSSNDFFRQMGGIHLINSAELSEEQLTLLYGAAVHIAPKAMTRLGAPAVFFSPVKLSPVLPLKKHENGYILNENEVSITKKTPVPWCHILSNPVFGTLVSNKVF